MAMFPDAAVPATEYLRKLLGGDPGYQANRIPGIGLALNVVDARPEQVAAFIKSAPSASRPGVADVYLSAELAEHMLLWAIWCSNSPVFALELLNDENVHRVLGVPHFGDIPGPLSQALGDICRTLEPREQVQIALTAMRMNAEPGSDKELDLLAWAWSLLEEVTLPEQTEVYALRGVICDSITRHLNGPRRSSHEPPLTVADHAVATSVLLRLICH